MKFDPITLAHAPLPFMIPYLTQEVVRINIGCLMTRCGWFRTSGVCARQELDDDLRDRIAALATFYAQVILRVGDHHRYFLWDPDKLGDLREFLDDHDIETDDERVIAALERMGFVTGVLTKSYSIRQTGTIIPFSWLMRGNPALLRLRT